MTVASTGSPCAGSCPTGAAPSFGFYYMNIHSRLPTINGITGPVSIVPEMTARGGAAALMFLLRGRGPAGRQPRGRRTSAATAAERRRSRGLRRIRKLVHGLPRGHQALRSELERDPRHLGHRLPGRGLLPPGPPPADGRRRAALSRRCRRYPHSSPRPTRSLPGGSGSPR